MDPRELLAAERAETLARLAALREDYTGVVDASRDTNADDEHDPEGQTIAFERSQTGALVRQAERHLAEVDAASTAGRRPTGAARCAAPIPPGRLEARPTARRCVAHAEHPRPPRRYRISQTRGQKYGEDGDNRTDGAPGGLVSARLRAARTRLGGSSSSRTRWRATTTVGAHGGPVAAELHASGQHPVGRGDAEVDEADRLVRRTAPGAGDPGDAHADVGAERGPRAVGHRAGDLGADRADGRRAAPAARRAGRAWRRRRRSPARPGGTPRSPAGPRADPPAARPCRTRRSRSSSRGRADRWPPARRRVSPPGENSVSAKSARSAASSASWAGAAAGE